MLQKANSNRMLITLPLQVNLRLNSSKLLHPNRSFRRKCQDFLRLSQSKSLCHLSWQPSTEQEQCPDVDEEEELSNGLPSAPTLPMRQTLLPMTVFLPLYSKTGLKKNHLGALSQEEPQKLEDIKALLLLKWEIIRTDLSCMCKNIVSLVATTQFPVQLSIWLRSQRKTQKGQHDGVQEKKAGENVKKRKILSTKPTDLKFNTISEMQRKS